jgi:putative transposase
VRANQAMYPITTMCQLLDVSTSGYYSWRRREPSMRARRDAALAAKIRDFHETSRGTYGSPRILEDLREEGIRVGRKRVARLMQEEGLRGVCRRKTTRTTRRNRRQRPAPDLVERKFTAERANQLWVADITYIPTWTGFLYLAVVLDVWSRKIVGWSMKTTLHTELVVEALDMAIKQRRPQNVIHHSDQGSQYTSIDFGRSCGDLVRQSMGSVGDCYDNAMCESFFASLECELINRRCFRNQDEARLEVFDYIEGFYNTHRRHSALGQLSPCRFEALHQSDTEDALATRFRRTTGLESVPDSSL